MGLFECSDFAYKDAGDKDLLNEIHSSLVFRNSAFA